MTHDEYVARMNKQLQHCLKAGKHFWVHGQSRTYCWECFHNGMEDNTNPEYAEREKLAATIPLNLKEIRGMVEGSFNRGYVLPIEYRSYFEERRKKNIANLKKLKVEEKR